MWTYLRLEHTLAQDVRESDWPHTFGCSNSSLSNQGEPTRLPLWWDGDDHMAPLASQKRMTDLGKFSGQGTDHRRLQ